MSELFEGLAYLGSGIYWVTFGVTIFAALIVGLVSGVSSTLVMALALTFIVLNIEDPLIGIAMLATLVGVGGVMNSAAAVLLGLPNSAIQVTFLEGNQLARRGLAAHTLGAMYAVSVIGGLTGVLVLTLALAAAALLGFTTTIAVVLYGAVTTVALYVVVVAMLNSGAMVKGMAAAAMGVLLGTSGLDPIEGVRRYAFGASDQSGLLLVAMIVGVFALAEVIDLTMTRQPLAPQGTLADRSEVIRGVRYGLGRWRTAVRQGLFGSLVSVVPGTSGAAVAWLSYAVGIFLTKDKRGFGRGSLDGLLLVESAMSASRAGGMFPTVLLGLPGGSGWTFVLVAMLGYGIAPGRMVERDGGIVTMMVLSLALGAPVVAAIGVLVTARLARLTLIPYPVIGIIAIPMLLLAVYASTESVSGIYVVVAAGVLGLLMKRYKWPRPPLIAGLLLSRIIEFSYSAAARQEVNGMLVWSALVFLLVAGVVVALVLKRGRIGIAGAPLEGKSASVGSSGGAEYPEGGGTGPPAVRPRIAVTSSSLFTMAIVAGAAWGFYEAVSSALPGRAFPLLASLAVVVLGSAQLVFDLRQGKTGTVMDIGMRSVGMAGARRTGLLMAAMAAVFIVLFHAIGPRYASIIFPIAPSLLFLEGRMRWIGAAVGVVLLAAFNVALWYIGQRSP